jgi:hypothetical protein
MVTPGVLLLVGHASGSLARAGLASGALAVRNGVGLVVQGLVAVAGPLFTCLAVGDLLGGLGYGAHRWRCALHRRSASTAGAGVRPSTAPTSPRRRRDRGGPP